MTVCNMSIEGGARAGMIAPDDTTFQYLAGRAHAPQGAAWDAARRALARAPHRRRRRLRPLGDARRERARADDHVRHEPGHGHADHRPRARPGAGSPTRRSARPLEKALAYMGLRRRASRSWASRSTSSSSAAAPTAASPTCARRPRS